MVKTFFIVFNQKSLAAPFNCCLLCSHCVPLCVALLYDPSSGGWHLDSPQPFLMATLPFSLHPWWHPQPCWGQLSPHGPHPWWRCQVLLALYQTLRNATHDQLSDFKLFTPPLWNWWSSQFSTTLWSIFLVHIFLALGTRMGDCSVPSVLMKDFHAVLFHNAALSARNEEQQHGILTS